MNKGKHQTFYVMGTVELGFWVEAIQSTTKLNISFSVIGTGGPSDRVLVKQAPCGKTSEGHLVFLLLKLNMKKGGVDIWWKDYSLWDLDKAEAPQGAE